MNLLDYIVKSTSRAVTLNVWFMDSEEIAKGVSLIKATGEGIVVARNDGVFVFVPTHNISFVEIIES